SVDSVRQMAEHAGSVNVKLAIEPLNRLETYLLTTHSDAARFVAEVDHPACGVMYDTFHANIEEKSMGQAIRDCAESLVHVHLSENDRSTPGAGHMAWGEVFDTLAEIGYDGWLT